MENPAVREEVQKRWLPGWVATVTVRKSHFFPATNNRHLPVPITERAIVPA